MLEEITYSEFFVTVARAFDFREYDAPVLEPLDLYVEKSGEEIVRQLFHFTDKGDRPVAETRTHTHSGQNGHFPSEFLSKTYQVV